MQQICPVCNGLTTIVRQCCYCGKTMEDQGHVTDYYGPYSPYEEDQWPQLSGQVGDISSTCTHFLFCPECRAGTKRAVKKVNV